MLNDCAQSVPKKIDRLSVRLCEQEAPHAAGGNPETGYSGVRIPQEQDPVSPFPIPRELVLPDGGENGILLGFPFFIRPPRFRMGPLTSIPKDRCPQSSSPNSSGRWNRSCSGWRFRISDPIPIAGILAVLELAGFENQFLPDSLCLTSAKFGQILISLKLWFPIIKSS